MRYQIWKSRNYAILATLFLLFDFTLINCDVLHIIIFLLCSV